MGLQALQSCLTMLASIPIVRSGYGHVEDQSSALFRALDDRQCMSVCDCFEQLLRSPWFTRRWIVQEVIFNPRVTLLAGAQQMSWEDFTTALYYLQQCLVRSKESHG